MGFPKEKVGPEGSL